MGALTNNKTVSTARGSKKAVIHLKFITAATIKPETYFILRRVSKKYAKSSQHYKYSVRASFFIMKSKTWYPQ
jgi:hypothetical protein